MSTYMPRFKVFKLRKRGGKKFRTIYMPDAMTCGTLKRWSKTSSLLSVQCDRAGVAHGFMTGRSPITNAFRHIGWEYTLTMDLEDFFDHVTANHVNLALSSRGLKIIVEDRFPFCFPNGRARQGLPTSPSMANIAACLMDDEIMGLQTSGRFRNFEYTRYADDLSFSFDMKHVGALLMKNIPRIVRHHKFKINPRKTRMQWSGAGNRVITGVVVTNTGSLKPTRETIRTLRAIDHQRREGFRQRGMRFISARQTELGRRLEGVKPPSKRVIQWLQEKGMREWSRLQPPHAWNQGVIPIQSTNLPAPAPGPASSHVYHFGHVRRNLE